MKVLNIFVAEDNPGDVMLLREMLNEHNVAHRLHVEDDGEAAIRFIRGYSGQAPCPDVFVIDMQMPGPNGLAVVNSIRDRSCFSSLPIVLMSSALSRTEQQYIKAIPRCFFFEKPIWLDQWFEISDFIRTLSEKPTSAADKSEFGGSQARG